MPFSWKRHPIESSSVFFCHFSIPQWNKSITIKCLIIYNSNKFSLTDERESKMNEVEELLELSFGINCKWFVQNCDSFPKVYFEMCYEMSRKLLPKKCRTKIFKFNSKTKWTFSNNFEQNLEKKNWKFCQTFQTLLLSQFALFSLWARLWVYCCAVEQVVPKNNLYFIIKQSSHYLTLNHFN